MKSYYVYIMASHRRVLYTGVTSKLETRAGQHQDDVFEGSFTARYRVHKLVYFETYSSIHRAIAREKTIKHFTRAEKIKLIESANPKWHDLSEQWKRRPQILPARFARRKDDISMGLGFVIEDRRGVRILRLHSADGTNRLTAAAVMSLTNAIRSLAAEPRPLILTGNHKFFSAGADLVEIAALTGAAAFAFARMGQELMSVVDRFPAPVIAAVCGYCMGGGLDLALACDYRIAHPHAVFGHRGAALGLITGWGGTQRLPRLVGKGRALEMLVAAEKVTASQAQRIGLVEQIADDPVAAAIARVAPLM
ncbi:MAG TPA: enoyl-CoA hydratase-related protein [Terriglobales bacterium]|nr:enoyl-CoA hydratase-related protein [Terriglobales bacterium]